MKELNSDESMTIKIPTFIHQHGTGIFLEEFTTRRIQFKMANFLKNHFDCRHFLSSWIRLEHHQV